MKELPKAYEPKNYEDDIYSQWEVSGFFNPDVCVEKGVTDADAEPFSIVLPPPNVTGTLHMGHAAMLAIEDTMVRYHRMKGDRALWIPGTDHAAVATESKVEGMLIDSGVQKPKEALGREAFLKKVEEFAQESHDTIIEQAKKMGASMDWSREAYTLDNVRNKAVNTVFKKMYEDGLIYRGYRVVNWSVKGQSTCSDDELVHVERPATMYYFKYSKDFPIPIASTRPETKFGDTAVAVHPEGKWKEYIGQEFEVKDFGQEGHTLHINVIADEHVDESLGTGALGVTPAHSMIDFEMYQKQKAAGNEIGLIQVIGEDGRMTVEAGSDYARLLVDEAREKIVAWLRDNDLMEKEEEIVQNVGTSDRFKDPVEPLPKTQWFVDVNKPFTLEKSNIKNIESGAKVTLKKLMQTVIHENQIEIIPDRFEKTYFRWIDNLRDWCISRQIWYGHRIPAYFDIEDPANSECILHFAEGQVFNLTDEYFHAVDDKKSCAWGSVGGLRWINFPLAKLLVENGTVSYKDLKEQMIGANLSRAKNVRVFVDEDKAPDSCVQDPDTLDTWFSSGMWTFSTLLDENLKEELFEDWLARSKDFQNYHPTQVLETGYDIIFFWVARMILMTTYTLGDIPFEKVYLHGLVRDEEGRKMSKSLGNIINPLDMIEKYGTDATRLSLMIGGTPGNDMKLSEEKVAGFRNFTNKLWNISRFMLMNMEDGASNTDQAPKAKTLSDKWILDSTYALITTVTHHIREYRFSTAGEHLRDFTWNDLADWYLEIAKIEGEKNDILNYILNTMLKLWHPFMPFVTEQLWQEMYGKDAILMVEKWPTDVSVSAGESVDIVNDFEVVRNIITGIRSVRNEHRVPSASYAKVVINTKEHQHLFEQNMHLIKGLARVDSLTIVDGAEKKENMIGFVVSGVEVFIDLADAVDPVAERARLEKDIANVEPYVATQEKKLGNSGFVDNAPEAVVAQERKKLEEAKEKLTKLKDQLSSL